MAINVRLVEETEVTAGAEPGTLELVPDPPAERTVKDTLLQAVERTAPTTTENVSRETEIIGALQILNQRLLAVEGTIKDVPKAAGLLRALIAALSGRALQSLSLAGCLGLAGAAVWQPSWQTAGVFGMFIVGVYLPLAALAYFERST